MFFGQPQLHATRDYVCRQVRMNQDRPSTGAELGIEMPRETSSAGVATKAGVFVSGDLADVSVNGS